MKRILFIALSLVFCLALFQGTASAADAWIGTYEWTEKEMTKQQASDMGMPWPYITFKDDGTYDSQMFEDKMKGTYTVNGMSFHLTALEVNGKPPKKGGANSPEFTFDKNYQEVVFPGGEQRFVKIK